MFATEEVGVDEEVEGPEGGGDLGAGEPPGEGGRRGPAEHAGMGGGESQAAPSQKQHGARTSGNPPSDRDREPRFIPAHKDPRSKITHSNYTKRCFKIIFQIPVQNYFRIKAPIS